MDVFAQAQAGAAATAAPPPAVSRRPSLGLSAYVPETAAASRGLPVEGDLVAVRGSGVRSARPSARRWAERQLRDENTRARYYVPKGDCGCCGAAVCRVLPNRHVYPPAVAAALAGLRAVPPPLLYMGTARTLKAVPVIVPASPS
ncbi:hypothetical protein STCU_10170 [Strigomonas culicis]|uniref:Uncharacterized protein n=1 Tax=Strigomonas culicis TaxID=28005 RepID=S9TP13_9TRYP|nr:hypothetical protein STCU_10170 [Strigomonas culicis]|eukprot:EPY18123.1 hypothetical protein STCU_10170 [Strigomonas culicis]